MIFRSIKTRLTSGLLSAVILLSLLASAADFPSEADVNRLFDRISDPVDLSYTEILDDLTALQGIIDGYSEDTQLMFKRLWCWNQYYEDIEDYILYANQQLNLEQVTQNLAAQADLLSCRGFYNYLNDDNDAAMADFDEALNLARRANDSLLIADAYSLMADVQSYQGEIARALTNYQNAFQFYQEAGNEFFTNDIRTSVANTLRRMGDYNNAEVYLAQQMSYYQRKKDALSEANVAVDYGILFLEKNEPENAVYWFDRSIELVEKELEKQALQIDERIDATAYFYKAEALARLGRGAEAKSSLDRSFSISPEDTDIPLNGPTSMVKSYIASANGDYSSAISFAHSAAEYYKNEDNDRLLINALKQVVFAEAELENYQSAYEAQIELEQTRERFRQQINEQLSERLKIEYNLSQKEFENNELLLRNENQRIELESKKRIGQWQSATLGLTVLLLFFLANRVLTYIRSSTHLKKLALTDSLTNLANRRAIETFAEQTFAQTELNSQPISFIAFDIDHFKQVNDLYGHDAGDAVIAKVAQLAKDCLRTGDMLARYGGEEFLAILPTADIEQASLVAQRICNSIANEKIVVRGQQIATAVSVGVAQRRSHEKSPSLTIRRADTALYEAKNNGRNQVRRAGA